MIALGSKLAPTRRSQVGTVVTKKVEFILWEKYLRWAIQGHAWPSFSKSFLFRVSRSLELCCVLNCLNLSQTSTRFLHVCSRSLLKTLGKGEIARNEQFCLFLQCFRPAWTTFCHFHQIWNCRLQPLSIWKSVQFDVWERVKHCYTFFAWTRRYL